MAVPSGGMSDEQIRIQLNSLIQQLSVFLSTLKEIEKRGGYITVEQRCELMKLIQEHLVIQVVDFSHTLMSDIKRIIDWAAQEKRRGI